MEDVAQSEEAMGQICATLALLQGQITASSMQQQHLLEQVDLIAKPM